MCLCYVILLIVCIRLFYESIFFIFFKQKTAYEILTCDGVQTCALPIQGKTTSKYKFKKADWWKLEDADYRFYNREITPGEIGCALSHYDAVKVAYDNGKQNVLILEEDFVPLDFPTSDMFRSEERRVGKECRSRWSPHN